MVQECISYLPCNCISSQLYTTITYQCYLCALITWARNPICPDVVARGRLTSYVWVEFLTQLSLFPLHSSGGVDWLPQAIRALTNGDRCHMNPEKRESGPSGFCFMTCWFTSVSFSTYTRTLTTTTASIPCTTVQSQRAVTLTM